MNRNPSPENLIQGIVREPVKISFGELKKALGAEDLLMPEKRVPASEAKTGIQQGYKIPDKDKVVH